ncbi:MAG: divalent-cation tolerance protein CutA [Acidobacteriota bacterium]|nr:divalent-cation tolerance protein CutA [Acidobacteriota bacterium]
MTDKIVVLSSCGSPEEAERLARVLLEAKLAACVSVVMQKSSFYWWKDKIEVASEWLLIIKTKRELFDPVRLKLELSHSYSVPEVIALPIVDGSPSFLAWMDSELAGPPLE